MKNIEILAAYEKEIGVIDSIDKPVTDDSLYILNQAVNKFVKLRFNGDRVHNTGVEQTEKRRNDLRKLITNSTNLITSATEDEKQVVKEYTRYDITYPTDFLYVLNENVVIADAEDSTKKVSTSVFECTRDSVMYRINNSLTDFHYNYGKARPIRVCTDKGCELYTDGNYTISDYRIGYIRKPNEITLQDRTNALSEYTDFDESTIYEIIKIAAQIYLENTKDERYKTISEEVLTQE